MRVTEQFRTIVEKAERGATLTDLYCTAPDMLQRGDRALGILEIIAQGSMTGEQAAHLARRHLGPGNQMNSGQPDHLTGKPS